MPLEDTYAGDEEFHKFALACASEWSSCADQQRLLDAVGGDLDLAMVCHYHRGDLVFDWLDKSIPALEDLTPAQCLQSENLKRRLKACLWQMP